MARPTLIERLRPQILTLLVVFYSRQFNKMGPCQPSAVLVCLGGKLVELILVGPVSSHIRVGMDGGLTQTQFVGNGAYRRLSVFAAVTKLVKFPGNRITILDLIFVGFGEKRANLFDLVGQTIVRRLRLIAMAFLLRV